MNNYWYMLSKYYSLNTDTGELEKAQIGSFGN